MSLAGPGRRNLRLALWVAVGAYLATIFALSSMSAPLPALTSRVSDKVLHAVEYGGLGLLLSAALRLSGRSPGRAAALGLLLASLYGASDELHQAFVPNRDCSGWDWLADTAGAALGALAAWRIRLPPPQPPA